MEKPANLKGPITQLLTYSLVASVLQAVFLFFRMLQDSKEHLAFSHWFMVFIGLGVLIVIFVFLVMAAGFFVASIFWLIWKILGSSVSYVTAYKIIASASSILIVWSLASLILPLLTPLGHKVYFVTRLILDNLSIGWFFLILTMASPTAAGISLTKSLISIGSIGALILTVSITRDFANYHKRKGPYQEALTYERRGNYEKAIEYYSQAIEKNPEFDRAYYDRGFLYEKMGDRDRALKDFQTSCFKGYRMACRKATKSLARKR